MLQPCVSVPVLDPSAALSCPEQPREGHVTESCAKPINHGPSRSARRHQRAVRAAVRGSMEGQVRPPPGLDMKDCSQAEMELMKTQIMDLKHQVDILSRIFLFVDVEQLCRKVEIHSMCDSLVSPTPSSSHSAVHDFEDVFTELTKSDAIAMGSVDRTSGVRRQVKDTVEAYAMDEDVHARVESTLLRVLDLEEEMAALKAVVQETKESIPNVGAEIVQPITEIVNGKCQSLESDINVLQERHANYEKNMERCISWMENKTGKAAEGKNRKR